MPVRGLPNIVAVGRMPRGKRRAAKARMLPTKSTKPATEPQAPPWARRR